MNLFYPGPTLLHQTCNLEETNQFITCQKLQKYPSTLLGRNILDVAHTTTWELIRSEVTNFTNNNLKKMSKR